MKPRYFLFALIGFELIALPASAGIVGKVFSNLTQHAVVTELPRQPGVAKLVISSNGPFVITAENMSGDIDLNLVQKGKIYTTHFGDNTQAPGPEKACATLGNSNAAIIYTADKATSIEDGEILSQSIVMEVSYAYDAQPVFKVMTRREAKKIEAAPACTKPQTPVTLAP